MEEIKREELVELFKALPKESFELLLRNVPVKDTLNSLWKAYEAGESLGYGERFESLFEEIFRFFFRPLEICLRGFRQLRLLFPIPELLESLEKQWELFAAYKNFLDSLFSHFQITTNILIGLTVPPVIRSALDEFRESWRERFERYYKYYSMLDLEDLKVYSDYPLILTKKTNQYLLDALEQWENFSAYYMEFKDMIRSTYREAIREFIRFGEANRFKNFEEFKSAFINISNQRFDSLLRSEKYLQVQGNMVSHLMDYLYRTRRFFEEMFENNPINPFATVGHVDEAHKRIMDLRRKLLELEKRVQDLETKKELDLTKKT